VPLQDDRATLLEHPLAMPTHLARRDRALAKIIRKWPCRPMLASNPASILNHKSSQTGMPLFDSYKP